MTKEKTVSAPERVIAAVLFLLLAISQLVLAIQADSFWLVLEMMGLLLVTVALFSRDRGNFAAGAFAFLAMVMLILFIRGLFAHGYSYIANYDYRTGATEYRFSFLALLSALVQTCAYLLLALLAAANFTDLAEKYLHVTARQLNRWWYLPFVLLLVSFLLSLLPLVGGRISPDMAALSAVTELPMITPFLFAALWIIGEEPEGYYPIPKHIFMSLITLGLWYVVWVWHNTRYLNRVENEAQRRPTASMLLCLFLPFYASYWNYDSAQRVDRLAKDSGVASKMDVLCLVIGLVIPFFPSVLIQDKINRITLVNNGVFLPDFPREKTEPPAVQSVNDLPVVDETLPEL